MPPLTPPAVPAGILGSVKQPVLTADALLLRPFVVDDVEALVRAYADPEIQRWHVRSLTPDEAEAWVEQRQARWQSETGADWAVIADGQLAGRVNLHRLDLEEGLGEVGYWIGVEHRGRGYATAAVGALSTWAFDLGLARLELAHSVHNERSCRVATRAGYALEGVKRHAARHADGWHDMHLHARIANEPREQLADAYR